LDGGQHAESIEYDRERDMWLVLRFWNNELMNEIEGVLERIRLALTNETLSPGPSPTSVRGKEEGSA
jgi:very-short-patch-repair endonuclease